MKKALVLAGGFPQIALIQELKDRGIYVVLADYNENPVAKQYASKYYQVSTLDVKAIRDVAVQEKVDYLITVCTDQALHTVAKVSEELGLPCYIDYQTALNVTNKQYMKKVFSENGIPTAKYTILDAFNEEAIREMHYPLIVKPVDCNSSKGVRRCDNLEELKVYFAEALDLSRTKTAIIEEFISGEEISVDVYVEDGKAQVLCISQSDKIADHDKFVIFRAIWPAPVSQNVVEQINVTAQKIAEAFKIQNSPMLIQFLTDGERVFGVEFSARTGGGVKYLLVKRSSGFDVIKAVVDLTLGDKPHIGRLTAEQNYMINDFIYCKPGVFDHLEGFDDLLKDGIIKDYYLFTWKGATFKTVKASGDRLAGYTVVGNTPEELIERHREARRRIRAISTEGDDMIRHDLLTDLIVNNNFLYSKKA